MVKVLFVCMGNICRSPTAEGVFTRMVQQAKLQDYIYVDSAGTHAYHVGEAPDYRATQAAAQRGVNLQNLRARQVTPQDCAEFDYILAMDKANYAHLRAICASAYQHKISLFLDYAKPIEEQEVPDPYYGGTNGFEHVLDLVEAASKGLLQTIGQSLNKA